MHRRPITGVSPPRPGGPRVHPWNQTTHPPQPTNQKKRTPTSVVLALVRLWWKVSVARSRWVDVNSRVHSQCPDQAVGRCRTIRRAQDDTRRRRLPGR